MHCTRYQASLRDTRTVVHRASNMSDCVTLSQAGMQPSRAHPYSPEGVLLQYYTLHIPSRCCTMFKRVHFSQCSRFSHPHSPALLLAKAACICCDQPAGSL